MAVMLTTTQAPSCSEHDLVIAARGRDDRAFAELYSRYQGRITTYVYGMVRDHGRAEDIAQEVFMSALRRLRATDRPIAFKPWIYEIAKNACIDEHRRSKRAREVPFAVEEELPGSDVALRSSAARPEEAVESKQRLDDLRGAFGGLSESHHKVLVMRELEGLSYAEIGQRLGMSRQVVESTLFRARRRLGQEYEELVSGRRCQQVQATIDAAGPSAFRTFGIRQRRQLTRHLAHCQPCRHVARMAGWSDDAIKPKSIAARVAALLPFPLLRWRRGSSTPAGGSSPHQLAAHGPLQSLAGLAEPLSSLGLGRAAAVAALALVGAGGGVATLSSHHDGRAAARSSHVPAVPSSGGTPAVISPRASSQAGSGRAAIVITPISSGSEPGSRPQNEPTARRHAPRSQRSSSDGAAGGGTSGGPTTLSGPASELPVSAPAAVGSSTGAPKVTGKVPSASLPLLHSGGTTSKAPALHLPSIQVPKLPSLSSLTGASSTSSSGSASGASGAPTLPKLKLPPLP